MNKYVCLLALLVISLSSCHIGGGGRKPVELFPLGKDHKMGYIDKTGKMVINLQFKDASLFYDGLALVSTDGADKRWGFIDETGKYIINPDYKKATIFSEGLAFAQREDDHDHLYAIDKKGGIKFILSATGAHIYSEGLAAYSEDDKWGFVDKEGKAVIDRKYNLTTDFSEGLCAVSDGSAKWGYINKKGEKVINCQFGLGFQFHNGVAIVIDDKDKYGLIDKNGVYIINPQYDGIRADNDIFIAYQNDKWGWIDKTGKTLINLQFETALPFYGNKLAPVKSNGNWGYVDNTGKFIIEPKLQVSYVFEGNVALATLSDKMQLIDNTGRFLETPEYDLVSKDYLSYTVWGNSIFNELIVDDAHQTAYVWLRAFYDMDFDKAKDCSTDETKKMLDMFGEFTKMMPDTTKLNFQTTSILIKDAKENGDVAVVTYETMPDRKTQTLNLIRVNDKWLVSWSKNDVAPKDKNNDSNSGTITYINYNNNNDADDYQTRTTTTTTHYTTSDDGDDESSEE